MTPHPSSRRIPELDSLRGLAAVVVMLGHWLAVMPVWQDDVRGTTAGDLAGAIKYSPLGLVAAGPQAVLLFFVLSGFVLAVPYVEGRVGAYRAFVVRRLFRIYPAAWVTVVFAIACIGVIGTASVPSADAFVNAGWHAQVSLTSALDHVALLGTVDPLTFDATLWSLVHELRISLVFPLLVAGALALGPWRASALAAVLAAVLSLHDAPLSADTSYQRTLCYIVCFVVGIALARDNAALARRRDCLPRDATCVLWFAVVLLLTSSYTRHGLGITGALAPATDLLAPVLGAAALIVLVQGGGAAALLRARVPSFLGEVSYSLYLWHMPILLVLTRTAGRHVAPFALAPVGIALALAAAAASRRLVEEPLTRVGARVAQQLVAARARPASAALAPARS